MGFITDTAAAIASEIFGDGGTAATGLKRSNKLIQNGEEYTVFTARMPKATSVGEGIVEEVIVVEGSVKEMHRATSKVTKNPVEFGPVIGDHRINEPRMFELDATITDYPLGAPEYDWGADLSGQTYSRAAWSKLNDIRENSYPFTLISGLQEYTNLLITDMVTSRTAQTATALKVKIRFEEIIMVTAKSEQVRSTDVSTSIREQTEKQKDGGQKVSVLYQAKEQGKALALKLGGVE